jgi:CRISPR-associated protein Cas2
MFYVVAYDIPDDKRRLKLFKAMHHFGRPVQRSVFECALDNAEKEIMISTIRKHIEPDEDKVTVYSLCSVCKGMSTSFGTGTISSEPDVVVI